MTSDRLYQMVKQHLWKFRIFWHGGVWDWELPFHETPNVLYWIKIWYIKLPIYYLKFSIMFLEPLKHNLLFWHKVLYYKGPNSEQWYLNCLLFSWCSTTTNASKETHKNVPQSWKLTLLACVWPAGGLYWGSNYLPEMQLILTWPPMWHYQCDEIGILIYQTRIHQTHPLIHDPITMFSDPV